MPVRISSLTVKNLRILEESALELKPGLIGITGPNGSGKTSLLEAMYWLGRGTSFRQREIKGMVKTGTDHVRVVGRIQDDDWNHLIGMEWAKGEMRVRVDGRSLNKRSDLLRLLPLLILTPHGAETIGGGPEVRRRLIDYALFHVEPEFNELALGYRRYLRQRNAALRQGDPSYRIWDTGLVQAGTVLATRRATLFESIKQSFLSIMSDLGFAELADMSWRQGWLSDQGLAEALASHRESDEKFGFTHVGPHRANLVIKTQGKPAEKVLSRGQQKLVTIALYLAIMAILSKQTERQPLFLIDDLGAELDLGIQSSLLDLFAERLEQVIITSLDPSKSLLARMSQVFHVEHGCIEEAAGSD